MLKSLGHESLGAMIDALVPADIRLTTPMNIPAALSAFDHLIRTSAPVEALVPA